ncbi:MAG: hypothetical protein Q8M57_02195 [Nitrosomonas sp.]|nr:hypothetical protein [Nitrosomonas sp.]
MLKLRYWQTRNIDLLNVLTSTQLCIDTKLGKLEAAGAGHGFLVLDASKYRP